MLSIKKILNGLFIELGAIILFTSILFAINFVIMR